MNINIPHFTLNENFEIIFMHDAIKNNYPAYTANGFFRHLLSGYSLSDFDTPVEIDVSPITFEKRKIVFIRNENTIECIPVENKDYHYSSRMKNAESIVKEPIPSILSALSLISDSLNKRIIDYRAIYTGIDVINNSSLIVLKNLTNIGITSSVLSGNYPKPVVTDFGKIIEDVVDTVEKFTSSVSFKKDIDRNILIDVNPELMTNAITNLIANSISFKEDEVEIEIKLERSENGALFSYSDNSKGIKENILPHIFKPYFSKDPYDDDEIEPSLGLGLFIVKSAFDQCGANLLVSSSQENGGVKYTASVPYSKNSVMEFESQPLWLIRSKFSTVAVQLSDVIEIPFDK